MSVVVAVFPGEAFNARYYTTVHHNNKSDDKNMNFSPLMKQEQLPDPCNLRASLPQGPEKCHLSTCLS